MKKIIFASVLSIFIMGCKAVAVKNPVLRTSVDTLLTGKYSIRAIAIVEGKVYYAANKNRVGFVSLDNKSKFERQITKDSLEMEFRSLAISGGSVFALTIANPALLYKFSGNLQQKQLVYQKQHEKVFYDSMQFWNSQEGIALGDPIAGCFSLIITRDGGNSWSKVPCSALPGIEAGEAAFAASNTNIIVKGDQAWLVSGGKKARVLHSSDKGNSWAVYETPIVQGSTMTGIFTADFYNGKIGIIAGGDYEKPALNAGNKAITTDGGKTWKLVGENTGFGYASCIQFVPGSNAKELVCVGATGVFYSGDRGQSWKQTGTDTGLFTLRFVDAETFIAAGKDKIVRMTMQR